MTQPASDSIARTITALAGGLDVATAVQMLRRESGSEQASLETLVPALRAEAARQRLDTGILDSLVAILSAGRSAPAATVARSAASATRMRDLAAPAAATRLAEDKRPPPSAVREEFHEGSLIKGRFELQTLVGRGGMGIVFRALDRRKVEAHDPKPEVAVKILNASFEQHPDAFISLQREASKAQSLAHPNIVTVFDFDRDGESVFITMELLRGESLDAVVHAVRRQGMERSKALPVIRGIAEGLAYAHRKGIVHSDLKPANIFLTADRTPKILDFGIARAVPSAADSGPKDEFDAGSLGAYTEAYATEEMVEGLAPAPADDMYAFGIIVYELLTGRHPFADKAAAQARAAQLTPAPIRSLTRREWQTLARTLSFDRDKRPRDAGEFLRLFFGTTRLRNALIAALAALVIVSGLFWYHSYQQAGPAVPFEQLPPTTQEQIRNDFAEGEKAWSFYTQQRIDNALTDSLSYYADAYRLHKGDRDAVRGLERAADEMLKRVRNDPDKLRDTAHSLTEMSEFFKNYRPVVKALGG